MSFAILRQEGGKVSRSAGLDSFERQIPCEDAVVRDEVKFGMPWRGGIVIELRA